MQEVADSHMVPLSVVREIHKGVVAERFQAQPESINEADQEEYKGSADQPVPEWLDVGQDPTLTTMRPPAQPLKVYDDEGNPQPY